MENEGLMARNMMSNHTDMQDKYCADCYDIIACVARMAREHEALMARNIMSNYAVIGHHVSRH